MLALNAKASSWKDVFFLLSKLEKSKIILKEEQKLAIFSLFSGRDVFVWLPMGFGKSICFQTFLFMFDRQHTRLGSISTKIDLVLCVLVKV